jgi:hypothetical protein
MSIFFVESPGALQADAEGGLSERARRRAAEIADEADFRARLPKAFHPPDRCS